MPIYLEIFNFLFDKKTVNFNQFYFFIKIRIKVEQEKDF
jgi:hypothetical protein